VTIGNAQKFANAKTPVNSPSIKKTPVKGDVYFAVSLMGVPLDQAQAVATTLAKDILTKL
jgi:hypothetical protein